MLHKLEKEFFPDDMTESNTFHILGESFFLTKKDPDGISRTNWNVYNWETRNRIISRSVKESCIYVVATYYNSYYRWDDYLQWKPMLFSPPLKSNRLKKEVIEINYNVGCGNPKCKFCKEKKK